MWWPRLEEKVNDILTKFNKKTNATTLRTDREILEEILALSRLYSSSDNKKTDEIELIRIDPNPFLNFIDNIESLFEKIVQGSDNIDIIFFLRMTLDPIQFLIEKYDVPSNVTRKMRDLYDKIDDEITILRSKN